MSHIQIRIDLDEKRRAQEKLDQMGLTLSSAIKLFLRNVADTGRLPFEISASSSLDTTTQPTPAKVSSIPKIPTADIPPVVLPAPEVKTWNPFEKKKIGS